MIRGVVVLALVLVLSGVHGNEVPSKDRDLENPCSEFYDGLLPYCVGLSLGAPNAQCGAPYDVSRRNAHHHDAFHTDNTMRLRDSPSHHVVSFTEEEYQTLDFFNPDYSIGAFSNGLRKEVHIPLTNGAARVDCPVSSTEIRLLLEGLSPGQEIWLAGDSEDPEGKEDWHGYPEGPFTSEAVLKSRGYTSRMPGSGGVVVVEGAGAGNVYIGAVLCSFSNGEWTQKAHNVRRRAVSSVPMEFLTKAGRSVEDLGKLHPGEVRRAKGESKEQAHESSEEVITGFADGWDDLKGFGGNSGDSAALEGRPYTPSDDDFCAISGDDYPCTEFCDFNNPCTVNSECMRDDQYPFLRTVPEYAAAHISFVGSDGRSYICSGGLLGQTLNYPPNAACGDDFVGTCANGQYNNLDSTRFLTSGHCLSTPESAATIQVVFNYSISCEQGITGNCYSGSKVTGSYNYACSWTTSGAELLVSSENDEFSFIASEAAWLPYGDFTLLELTGTLPAKRCYFGYSTINHANNYGEILHRVSHPGGAPRAYCQSRVSQGSDWEGGPMENSQFADLEDYFASMHTNITGVGLSALGPQGGSSGGILFNDYAQAVGSQTGWAFFWGWVVVGSRPNYQYIHGSQINGYDMNPCEPNSFGSPFYYSGYNLQAVNQYIVIDGAFYSYYGSVEEELQDLCCPPFNADSSNRIVATTKLDFNTYPDGSLVLAPSGGVSGLLNPTNAWSDWGITVLTQKPGQGNSWKNAHPPQLFNSSNPCCGDFDLGTPNQYYGGPGIGVEGGIGPGANSRRQNWVMIISENNDEARPDDEAGGGAIVFLFDNPVPFAFAEIIDIDLDEVDGYIQATNDNGVVTQRPIVAYGENAYYKAEFYVTNIVNITVFFPGSGAIGGITFCDVNSPPLNSLGNFVWFDQNGNGIQDVYETTGVEGVVVQLHAVATGTDSDERLAETVTDENGWYQFTSLADGEYVVSFTVSDSLAFFDPYEETFGYNGWVFSPVNKGGDIAKDSNAIVESSNRNRALTSDISLSGGVTDNTWDVGIVIDADYDICILDASVNNEEKERKAREMTPGKGGMSYKPKRASKMTHK